MEQRSARSAGWGALGGAPPASLGGQILKVFTKASVLPSHGLRSNESVPSEVQRCVHTCVSRLPHEMKALPTRAFRPGAPEGVQCVGLTS
jgi:hypothetical protein